MCVCVCVCVGGVVAMVPLLPSFYSFLFCLMYFCLPISLFVYLFCFGFVVVVLFLFLFFLLFFFACSFVFWDGRGGCGSLLSFHFFSSGEGGGGGLTPILFDSRSPHQSILTI